MKISWKFSYTVSTIETVYYKKFQSPVDVFTFIHSEISTKMSISDRIFVILSKCSQSRHSETMYGFLKIFSKIFKNFITQFFVIKILAFFIQIPMYDFIFCLQQKSYKAILPRSSRENHCVLKFLKNFFAKITVHHFSQDFAFKIIHSYFLKFLRGKNFNTQLSVDQ